MRAAIGGMRGGRAFQHWSGVLEQRRGIEAQSTRDLDPLRDEGLAFGRRLIDDGVAVDIRHYAGTVHGTLGFTGAPVRERILRDAVEYVADRLSAPVR